MAVTQALRHHYQQARRWQAETYSNNGEHDHTGRNLRLFSGGGAAVGHHAEAAIASARHAIHFKKWLSEKNREAKRRARNKRK